MLTTLLANRLVISVLKANSFVLGKQKVVFVYTRLKSSLSPNLNGFCQLAIGCSELIL